MTDPAGPSAGRDWGLLVTGLAIAAASILWGPQVAGLVPVASPVAATAIFFAVIFAPMSIAATAFGVLGEVKVWRSGDAATRWVGYGLLLGIGGLMLAAGDTWLAGSLVKGPVPTAIGAATIAGVVLIGIQVACEEVFFRGWVQPLLARRLGTAAAIGGSALLFAAFHMLGGARSPLTLLNLVLGGVWFALLAARSGGVAGPIAAHFGWNASEQLVLGLDPNPGVGDFGSFFDFDLAGTPMWGGTEEGLNASIAMTFVLLALVVPWLVSALSLRAPRRSGRAPV